MIEIGAILMALNKKSLTFRWFFTWKIQKFKNILYKLFSATHPNLPQRWAHPFLCLMPASCEKDVGYKKNVFEFLNCEFLNFEFERILFEFRIRTISIFRIPNSNAENLENSLIDILLNFVHFIVIILKLTWFKIFWWHNFL